MAPSMDVKHPLVHATPSSPLRAARLKKGLSLKDAAALARTDTGHLSRVERGQAQPSLDVLYRLAVVLNLRRLRFALAPYLAEFTETEHAS